MNKEQILKEERARIEAILNKYPLTGGDIIKIIFPPETHKLEPGSYWIKKKGAAASTAILNTYCSTFNLSIEYEFIKAENPYKTLPTFEQFCKTLPDFANIFFKESTWADWSTKVGNLPDEIFDALVGGEYHEINPNRQYKTNEEAKLALRDALRKLNKICD